MFPYLFLSAYRALQALIREIVKEKQSHNTDMARARDISVIIAQNI